MSRNDMPCGNCPVCDDVVDFSDAGVCKTCGLAFHWNECGGWHAGEHTCFECVPEDER